jgi:hypothetical protein
VITHEVFHCLETEIDRAPIHKWINEGLARWVDLALFPKTNLRGALENLSESYNTPQRPLSKRAYDAVGFWAHVEDATGNLWHEIPKIIRADAHHGDAHAAHQRGQPSSQRSATRIASVSSSTQGVSASTGLPKPNSRSEPSLAFMAAFPRARMR